MCVFFNEYFTCGVVKGSQFKVIVKVTTTLHLWHNVILDDVDESLTVTSQFGQSFFRHVLRQQYTHYLIVQLSVLLFSNTFYFKIQLKCSFPGT